MIGFNLISKFRFAFCKFKYKHMCYSKEKVVNVGIVSGGFDPLTVGHVRMINSTANSMDEVWVIINNDNWLVNKKGFYFMPQNERREIMISLKGVTKVVLTGHKPNDTNTTVCNEIANLVEDAPDTHLFTFCNGGDRGPKETPESELCNSLGVSLAYNVGGDKIQSSSELVKQAIRIINDNRI